MAGDGRVIVMGRKGARDVFVSDREVEAIEVAPGGVTVRPIWHYSGESSVPHSGKRPPLAPDFPPVGGFHYTILTIPAGANDAYHAFVDNVLGDHARDGKPGAHWTPTVDCIVVTQGELVLEADAQSVRVGPGESVIINGNRHRWCNPGPCDAVLHAISIGAKSELKE